MNIPIPIPAAINLAIGAVALSVDLVCLWAASHTSEPFVVAVSALVFACANNTVFCLLHECVHFGFHSSRWVNEAAGSVFAAFFPTALTIQRVSHFGHHRRNRTDLELYDYYLPHESRWLKTYWIYCLLTGLYWAVIPVAGVLYLFFPFAFRSGPLRSGPARWWGFEEFVRDIAAQPIARVWPQALFTVCLQVSMWRLLDLSWARVLLCYGAFGVAWSSLQYTDHAWSPRDVYEGAWNLRVWTVAQTVLLNYNLHLAHHRRPDVPWIHLPKFVKPGDAAPSFSSIYWPLWRGAAPAPPGAGPAPLPPGAFRTSESRP
ncbi:MAG TPA: fatty acid desaturase [Vicinamibacterales bacterium]|nr:fatty acid desaturase [Vicinamibacterales bacterium]